MTEYQTAAFPQAVLLRLSNGGAETILAMEPVHTRMPVIIGEEDLLA